MNKRLILITLCIVLMLFAAVQLKKMYDSEETFTKNAVKYGSSGADVSELQGRLKYLGFFHGDIDGNFGYKTLEAVKWYQGEFGMTVDGVVGPKTKLKIWESTQAWKPTAPVASAAPTGQGGGGQAAAPAKPNLNQSSHLGYSSEDLRMMANAVFGEARGEPYEGQVAVAAVILNRVKSASFPNTIHGVIFQPGAFTAVSDGQIWLTPDATAMNAVHAAVNGWDPTNGCDYYFNPKTATSKWIWSRPQYKTIGNHIFCR
jgi:N-acetylmuramoyl-L-alanine amidase